jgi:aldehyde dehydrogenase (NAD+)
VSFTGSVAAGRAVAATAASHGAAATLELGGKSPAVLLDDADLDRAVPGAVGAGLVNSGQACNATTRLVVPRRRLPEIEERIAAAVDGLRVGDPADPSTTHGPLASHARAAAVRRVVDRAVGDGARVVARHPAEAGDRPVVAPVVLGGLDPRHDAVRREIFGPVLVVQPYDEAEEAAAIANDSDYGLSAEVWSADPERAAAFARRLDVGQVKVNGARTRDRVAAPFGGVKDSGYGRELGHHGIADLTTVTAVLR